jgi:hypothetical protein
VCHLPGPGVCHQPSTVVGCVSPVLGWCVSPAQCSSGVTSPSAGVVAGGVTGSVSAGASSVSAGVTRGVSASVAGGVSAGPATGAGGSGVPPAVAPLRRSGRANKGVPAHVYEPELSSSRVRRQPDPPVAAVRLPVMSVGVGHQQQGAQQQGADDPDSFRV